MHLSSKRGGCPGTHIMVVQGYGERGHRSSEAPAGWGLPERHTVAPTKAGMRVAGRSIWVSPTKAGVRVAGQWRAGIPYGEAGRKRERYG